MQEKPVCKYLPDGSRIWKLNNKLHREDGPAIEDPNGDKYWFINGQCHREDGPASEFGDGGKDWFWHDRYIPVKSQEEFKRYLKLKAFW